MIASGRNHVVEIPLLLRGEAGSLRDSVADWNSRRAALQLFVILAGTGVFGAVMGCWRSPMQALYTAVKFPLIILLTTLGNGLLNALLAPLIGLNLGFRQVQAAILASFMLAAVILAAFSPLLAFLIWNAPAMAPGAEPPAAAYNVIQLTEVAMIAFAGVAANVRLAQSLRDLGGAATARRVLFAWLAGNLLLGSQLSWNLRPFIGSPHLPVEFLRPNAFEGNFFETLFQAFLHLLAG
jgi:hypothetical protein